MSERVCQGVGAHRYEARYINAPCPVCESPAAPLRPFAKPPKVGGKVWSYPGHKRNGGD